MPAHPTTPTPPVSKDAARIARERIDKLLDSLDPETLAALRSGAIFDADADDDDTSPADAPVGDDDNDDDDDAPIPERDGRPGGYKRQRAWTLHCRGMRSPEIAEALTVPARTVRHWLARDREAVQAELPDLRRELALTAVESLRAALSAAWAAFEDERATEEEFATAIRRFYRVRLLTPEDAASAPEPPRYPNHAARYLSLALAAQRDLIRLLGLSPALLEDAPAVSPQPAVPPSALPAAPEIAAKTASARAPTPPQATNAALPAAPATAAKTATPATDTTAVPAPALTRPDPVPAGSPSSPSVRRQSTVATPAPTAPEIAAKTANARMSIPSPRRPRPAGAHDRAPSLAHQRRKAARTARTARTAKTANDPVLILPRSSPPASAT